MLTVVPLATGSARYYLSLTASSYYLDAPEPSGRWYGLGAKEFELEGTVVAEDLEKLCRGFHPQDPSLHVRNAITDETSEKGHSRKTGDDLCFSPPKSVSVAWALGSPELRAAIEKAMHRAVKDALDFVQEEGGYSRVGAQGQRIEKVPLTFALFEHSSSRDGDPQLHVHVVCPNLTLRTDPRGKLVATAVDSTSFYDLQMAAGALFRASLAEGLREMGFTIERKDFAFRIQGIGDEICDRFSQRRASIVDGILKAAKFTGKLTDLDAREVLFAARGRMAELVTLATRREKKEYTRADMLPIWQDIGRKEGIGEKYIQSLISSSHKLTPHQRFMAKEELWRDTLKSLENEFSHFSLKDLTRKLAEESQGRGLSGRDVRELVENKISGQDIVTLGDSVTRAKNQGRNSFREKTEERFTTLEMLKIEGLMLSAVEKMSQKSAPIRENYAEMAIKDAAKQLAKKGHTLFEEQKAAIRHLTTGEGMIACLTGKAGTGKSTTLDACRAAWVWGGRDVIGCAFQGKAKDGLEQSSGITSYTIHSLLFRLDKGMLSLRPSHVVVLDEAGMVPTKLMAALIHRVEKAGAKLVLVGDADQLQPIGAGGPFRSIAKLLDRKGEKRFHCQLTNVIRQREEWRRDTVTQLSRGEAAQALTTYLAKGQLHVTKGRDDALSKLVEQWRADKGVEKPKDVLLLASLNAEVKAINRMCQEERRAAGLLKDEKLTVAGDPIYEGDRVLLGKNQKKLGVSNGDTATVVKADSANGWLTVRLDKDDKEVLIPVSSYGAKNIRLGYAMTVHKSQGVTVKHCHVLMGSHMDNLHLGYVQASRCRESTHLFVDQAHAGPGLKNVIRQMSRAVHKDLATDILEANRNRLVEQQAVRDQIAQEQRRGVAVGF